jgi:hypothetical protein
LEQRRGRARQRATGAGPNHHLVFADRLLIILVVLRFQLPHKVLAVMFGVDRSTVTRAVHEVRPCSHSGASPSPAGLAYGLRPWPTCSPTPSPRASPCGSTARKCRCADRGRRRGRPDAVGRATRPGRMHDATAVRTEGIEDLLAATRR